MLERRLSEGLGLSLILAGVILGIRTGSGGAATLSIGFNTLPILVVLGFRAALVERPRHRILVTTVALGGALYGWVAYLLEGGFQGIVPALAGPLFASVVATILGSVFVLLDRAASYT